MRKLRNTARAGLALAVAIFWVFGTGCAGGANSASNSTPPPPAPTPQVAHSINVTWDASPSGNLQGYKVYRGQISGGPYTNVSGTLTASTLQFTDSSVAAGQKYFYVVTSIDNNGLEGAPSSEVSAQVPTP